MHFMEEDRSKLTSPDQANTDGPPLFLMAV